MSQLGKLIVVRSDPATLFTNASAQNAAEFEDIPLPGLGVGSRGRVVRIILRITTNNIFDVMFYGSLAATGNPTIATGNFFTGRQNFAIADGVQIAATGPFLYDKACDIPVLDLVKRATPSITVALVNRSAGALAGGANTAQLDLWIDPTGGF